MPCRLAKLEQHAEKNDWQLLQQGRRLEALAADLEALRREVAGMRAGSEARAQAAEGAVAKVGLGLGSGKGQGGGRLESHTYPQTCPKLR